MNLPPMQYFFPGWLKSTPPPELADRFAVSVNVSSSGAHGPNAQKGRLFSSFPNTQPCFVESRQRWSRYTYIAASGNEMTYWIGVDKSASAESFERQEMLPGSAVELTHGDWIIPVANPLVETCCLPFFEVTDGRGNWYKEYKEGYIDAKDIALKISGMVREAFVKRIETTGWGAVDFELEQDEFRKMIGVMIGVNYDLTIEEMSALRLFDQGKYLELIFTFCDCHTMIDMMKMEAAEGDGTINPTAALPDGSSTACGDRVS